MCCLFGMLDYGGHFTGRQRTSMLHALATECEARGTDATGIAYNSGGVLRVYKRPVPAHKLNFCIPSDAIAVMGHTRLTTQGSEKKNYNNHPFLGHAGNQRFALAHNGVLHNDHILRRSQKLPQTRIQTDSYVAVQLIEKKKALGLDSLKYMAEQVEGSFTFTALDEANNWYLVKGDNPMCLLHFHRYGLYLYASTDDILSRFLGKAWLGMGKPVKIKVDCGEILKVCPTGGITRTEFDTASFWSGWPMRYGFYTGFSYQRRASPEQEHLDEVKSVAAFYGYTPENIDAILEQGFTLDDVEDFLYCGRL